MSNTTTATRKPRTRKAAVADVSIDLDLDSPMPAPRDDIDFDGDPIVVEPAPVVTDDVAPPARKYMSHANCDHARQGEAGKKARAACRRAMRAAADVAVAS